MKEVGTGGEVKSLTQAVRLGGLRSGLVVALVDRPRSSLRYLTSIHCTGPGGCEIYLRFT